MTPDILDAIARHASDALLGQLHGDHQLVLDALNSVHALTTYGIPVAMQMWIDTAVHHATGGEPLHPHAGFEIVDLSGGQNDDHALVNDRRYRWARAAFAARATQNEQQWAALIAELNAEPHCNDHIYALLVLCANGINDTPTGYANTPTGQQT